MDILNLEEHFHNKSTHVKEQLELILEAFKHGHYQNVLSELELLRSQNNLDQSLSEKLKMVEAICEVEIDGAGSASEIIKDLYHTSDMDGVLLGEFACMFDYRLARRILSGTVKQMEDNSDSDRIKLARGYLVLAEVEENLEKYIRAIKYFKTGLSYFQEKDARDQYMIIYIHFKIGMIYSLKNNPKESIAHLEKVVDMAGDTSQELKINSMVSIAKTYGSQNESDKAYSYLNAVIELIKESSLENKMPHAEALTEMAYYYFDKSELAEAVPYYKNAIEIYKKEAQISRRKLGMVHMQYAYCLEHMKKSAQQKAGMIYEQAIEALEQSDDQELLENAMADVMAFFDKTGNTKKKQHYENKYVKLTSGKKLS